MKITTKTLLLFIPFILGGSLVSADENHEKHHAATSQKTGAIKKTQVKKSSHADHTPKHGGQFFMAPNKFHHLEGVMPAESEFRIYFYNDHTKAIGAAPFREGSKIEAQPVGPDGRETGMPVDLPVAVSSSGSYLMANLPKELKLPIYFTAWLKFPNQKDPELFNFTFDKVSVPGRVGHSLPSLNTQKQNGTMAIYQCPMKDSPVQDKPGKCPKCGMNMNLIQK